LPYHLVVPLVVASALFLQQTDATALATSLPAISAAFGETPVRVHLALTAYMFSLAAFIPVSGWVADRFGSRNVFRVAIAVFTLSSLACGFAGNLSMLVGARVVQGIGGAMMVPVGRLILLRSVEKKDLVGALAAMSIPALLGPILGPLVGGFFTSYASWRWIFWVNLPVGIVGIVLATVFIKDAEEPERRRFDLVGVLLVSLGLSSLLFGIDAAATSSAADFFALACLLLGALGLVLYVGHARRSAEPVIDLSLLAMPTLRTSLVAGFVFRIGSGAMPFLLPLLFQTQFGYSAMQSGATTFVTAVGALGIRTLSTRIYRRVEFRALLMVNAVIAAGLMAACALFRPTTWYVVIVLTLFLGGVFRSLELVGVNALNFAELSFAQMSHGTTLSAMAQRLSQSIGVATAAFILHVTTTPSGLPPEALMIAFTIVGAIAASSAFFFAGLSSDAGAELAGRAVASRPDAPDRG
jgi:EmrB/QacA subfamily drug resistance transporter